MATQTLLFRFLTIFIFVMATLVNKKPVSAAALLATTNNNSNSSRITNFCCPPPIFHRCQWGARLPKFVDKLPVSPAPFVVIHHTAWSECFTESSCTIEMKKIQDFHMDDRGWQDIGYNFLVGMDGLIYEGRGWNVNGAHAPPYNNQSVGISFMGTFTDKLPTAVSIEAVKLWIRWGVQAGYIKNNYQIIGHRQARDTECPGDLLYSEIQQWPQYTGSPKPLRLIKKQN